MTTALVALGVGAALFYALSAVGRRLRDEAPPPEPHRPAPFEGAYASTVDRFLDGLWDWRVAEDVEHYSARFARMLGYDSLRPSPETWQRLIYPEDLRRSLANWARHVESRGEHRYDQIVRYRRRDGSTAVIHCRGEVTDWAPDGTPLRAQGVHSDLTDLVSPKALDALIRDGEADA